MPWLGSESLNFCPAQLVLNDWVEPEVLYRAGLASAALAPFPPAVPRPQAVTRVTLHWDDGTSCDFYPPAAT